VPGLPKKDKGKKAGKCSWGEESDFFHTKRKKKLLGQKGERRVLHTVQGGGRNKMKKGKRGGGGSLIGKGGEKMACSLRRCEGMEWG